MLPALHSSPLISTYSLEGIPHCSQVSSSHPVPRVEQRPGYPVSMASDLLLEAAEIWPSINRDLYLGKPQTSVIVLWVVLAQVAGCEYLGVACGTVSLL